MRAIYTLRDRYALPAIASLLTAVLLSLPVGAMPPFHVLHHSAVAQAVHMLLGLVLFVMIFVPAEQVWRRWFSRRPGLVLLTGGSTRGADGRAEGQRAKGISG